MDNCKVEPLYEPCSDCGHFIPNNLGGKCEGLGHNPDCTDHDHSQFMPKDRVLLPDCQKPQGEFIKRIGWKLCRCIYDYMGIDTIEDENSERFNEALSRGGEVSWFLGTLIPIDDKIAVRVELEGSKENLEYILGLCNRIEQLEAERFGNKAIIKGKEKLLKELTTDYEKLQAANADLKQEIEEGDEAIRFMYPFYTKIEPPFVDEVRQILGEDRFKQIVEKKQ
ncbi:MAG: hypothetical protein MUP81_03360 [Dehalococcoidia bacterium]|nr:hypothetical protein [Dehalococcoidia bacterium]